MNHGTPASLEHLVEVQSTKNPLRAAIECQNQCIDYLTLSLTIEKIANGFGWLDIRIGDRIAILARKTPESVFAIFGTSKAGGVFVPINPVLKPDQITYILDHSSARFLVLSAEEFIVCAKNLNKCSSIDCVIVTGEMINITGPHPFRVMSWVELLSKSILCTPPKKSSNNDLAAIFYTSGSTGKPKGVMLSHANLITGAISVAYYIGNTETDKLLVVLPLSFDYGFSQLTTAFMTGASVVLMEYLFPKDIVKAIQKFNITGLAGVPHIWSQLVKLDWPKDTAEKLRYITNSGGTLPLPVINSLIKLLQNSDIYLMYGLTEAFRSTYLPPKDINSKPGSIGKAIPNAELDICRSDGTVCDNNEIGEMVHSGPLVGLGYWKDPESTSARFKTARDNEALSGEKEVWTGDFGYRDKDEYIYFVGRKDDMIKTLGYRISPTEIEEVLYQSGTITEALVFGLPHPTDGTSILAVVTGCAVNDRSELYTYCKSSLPAYMQPKSIVHIPQIPRNQNNKLDRKLLADEYRDFFINSDIDANQNES